MSLNGVERRDGYLPAPGARTDEVLRQIRAVSFATLVGAINPPWPVTEQPARLAEMGNAQGLD